MVDNKRNLHPFLSFPLHLGSTALPISLVPGTPNYLVLLCHLLLIYQAAYHLPIIYGTPDAILDSRLGCNNHQRRNHKPSIP